MWLGILLAAVSGALEVMLPLVVLLGENRRRMWLVLVRGFSARASSATANWVRTTLFPTLYFFITSEFGGSLFVGGLWLE